MCVMTSPRPAVRPESVKSLGVAGGWPPSQSSRTGSIGWARAERTNTASGSRTLRIKIRVVTEWNLDLRVRGFMVGYS